LGVQETKIQADKDRHLLYSRSNSHYTGIWNHTATHYNGKGVGILIHKTWSTYLTTTFSDQNGRGIGVLFGFKHGFQLAVINCYFPPKGSNTYTSDFQQLHEWVTTHVDKHRARGAHVLLLGDFNGVVNPAIDRVSTNRTSSTPELSLFPWLLERCFVDTLRSLHPSNPLFTFRSHHQVDTSRIDMVWASAGLASYLLRTDILAPEEFESTDHSLMLATFDLHTCVRPENQAILAAQRPKDK
jgi:exonuclease III